MPRPKNNLTDMEIDEISTVDKAANQHSRFVIAKRAPEEEEMPKLYNQEGQPLDEDQLEFGDIVYDDQGQAYEYVEDESAEPEQEMEKDEPVPELAGVGKSAFFENHNTGSSFSASVMEELSKAFSDKDRDAVIAKALGRVEELESQQRQAMEIAKSERDLRLTREYISKAAEYNLPIPATELGPVLYRMAETMSFEDCSVIAKALETAGEIIFEEKGYSGGGDNADVYSQVAAHAYDQFGKSENFDSVSAINTVFDQNPDAYDEYLRSQQAR
jgi:hypothetical protein